MKKILKKYKITDIIIFGSYIKAAEAPKDIDLAFLVNEKDPWITASIKEDINIQNIHLEFILIEEIYSSKLFLSLINEGFSIKNDDYLRNILKTHPMKLYSYDLKHLNRSNKTLFGMALKKCIKKIKGEKISAGSVLIPLEQTSYFDDFLATWGMKYKTKEWIVIGL